MDFKEIARDLESRKQVLTVLYLEKQSHIIMILQYYLVMFNGLKDDKKT